MAVSNGECNGDWLGLKGRICAVTGAGGGIGAETARQLVHAGAHVALLDRNVDTLRGIAEELGNAGGHVMQIACDVTHADSIQRAADQIHAAWGPVSLLVNNAGVLYADALLDISIDKWNQLLSVNLTGYLLCSQVFGRQMIAAGGGALVHIASIAGSVPQPYSGAYSVSKSGVMMLSRQLAVELGEHGVRSNVVSPAMIRTPMSEVIYANPQVRERREQIVPAGRISTPEDIAGAVLFLASDRAGYVSGQEILVDGGLTQAWLGLVPRPGFQKEDAAASSAA